MVRPHVIPREDIYVYITEIQEDAHRAIQFGPFNGGLGYDK